MTNSNRIGKRIVELDECNSTNQSALEKIANYELAEGDVLVTKNQKAGKGQRGNSWESKKNQNLTLSYVLEPVFLKPAYQFELTVITSLAVLNLLKKFEINAKIKWPNDIYVEGEKIAGILIENKVKGNKISHAVVGIGLNVNQLNFQTPSAISMRKLTGEEYSLFEVLMYLSENLQVQYTSLSKGEDLRPKYHDNLIGVDQEILFEDHEQFLSKVVGVDDYGALILNKNGEEVKYGIKEVKFLGL